MKEQKTAIAVIFADLDYFKKINDQYGHLAGDEVLRETVRRIGAMLRPYDSLGRYGGEELLVVLPVCEAANAAECSRWLKFDPPC